MRRDPGCPLHEPIDDVTEIDVSADCSVGELHAALGDGDVPLAWAPVLEREECLSCGFEEERWELQTAKIS